MSMAQARMRLLERHGAASLRALSATADAEYRASRVRVDGRVLAFASPWLAADFATVPVARSRGVVDSLGLRLRYSDAELHARLSPEAGFARVVFDVLEQLRCDSLFTRSSLGVRGNLDAAFLGWCNDAHGSGIGDSSLGILLYTLIHMARARLIGTLEDETAEMLIEATRAALGPMIGKPLYRLPRFQDDQAGFAGPARDIAETLDAMIMAGDSQVDADDKLQLAQRHAIVLPPDWADDSVDEAGGEGGPGSAPPDAAGQLDEHLDAAGDYTVFTREFDSELAGDSLYRPGKRRELRSSLDKLVAAQAVSVPRLARELQALFATWQDEGWRFGQDEGLIDARRLAQLVGKPEYRQVFVRANAVPKSDAVVSFLVDNSGSMKRQRFAAVAVLMDTLCRALTLAGVQSEVLGFTTGDWNGGRALKAWRKAGAPADPGRIGEVQHIVYKHADASWRRARESLACMLETQHFREGLDGEALVWAYRRLQARREARRYLVVISDGAPMDAATHNANREGFLDDHLLQVAEHIDRRGEVMLGGIGIDLDVSPVYRHSTSLELAGTLGQSSYRVFHTLFGRRRG